MTSLHPDELRTRTGEFFAWFRSRADNIDRIKALQRPDANVVPECNVLLSATLDALSKYWAATFRPDLHASRMQFAEFLRQCGGSDIFARCCRSELIELVRHDPEKIKQIKRLLGDLDEDGYLREWHDDPFHAELTKQPAFKALRLDDRKVRETRYAEVIYLNYRCPWIHEFKQGDKLALGAFHPERTHPWYENMGVYDEELDQHDFRRMLVLPWAFLRGTLSATISGLESLCAREGRVLDVLTKA